MDRRGKSRQSLFRLLLYFSGSALLVTGLFGARLLVTRGLAPQVPRVYLLDILNALIILVTGYLVSFIVERYVFRYSAEYPGVRRQATVRFLTRLSIYLAVALAVLAAFGVSFSNALFGGAFLTVLLGLAGQTVLSNLLAGVALVLTRPFEVGDRIAFMTWQFPVLMPSYPHGALRPVHTGEITDLRLMHTALRTDEGPVLLIPNGIMIQAAIENLSRTPGRGVSFRFDVDAALDPGRVEADLVSGLAGEAWVVPGTCRVAFVDLRPEAYSLAVSFESHLWTPDSAKSAALKKAAAVVAAAKGKAPA